MHENKIAIVGMSCRFPKANSVLEFWSNIKQGINAISDFPINQRWGNGVYIPDSPPSLRTTYCKKGGVIDYDILIDPIKYKIPPKSINELDPDHLLTLKLCEEALIDAGISVKENSKNKSCGVIIGRSAHVGPTAFKIMELNKLLPKISSILRNSSKNLDPNVISNFEKQFLEEIELDFNQTKGVGIIGNLVASRVCEKFNLEGPACIIDGACSSSLLAIEHSISYLLNGDCDMMLAGGIYFPANYFFWLGFSFLTALSKSQSIRPFDKKADGILIGEGGGVIALKRFEDAIANGDYIYSVINSVSSNSNGKLGGVLAPSSIAQIQVYKNAWEKSGLDIQELDYVECHGTGMALGDQIEVDSLKLFFEESIKKKTPIGSIKSMIGHTISASGIAGVIKTTMAINEGIIPPSLNCDTPIDSFEESKFYVQTKSNHFSSKNGMTAGVNAFGFGGINCHLILSHPDKYKIFNSRTKKNQKKTSHITEDFITISDFSVKGLITNLNKKNFEIKKNGTFRLAILNPTQKRINEAISIIKKGKSWFYNDIYFSPKGILTDPSNKIAFVFPGISMFFPSDFETLLSTNNLVRYWKEKDKNLNKESLMGIKTMLANYAIFKSLEKKNIAPDAIAGHSLGDWTATFASRMIPEEEIMKVIYDLTRAKNELKVTQKDYLLVFVACSAQNLNQWNKNQDYYIALDNSPNSTVICINKNNSEDFFNILKERKILNYKIGFELVSHTPLNQKLMDDIKPIIDNLSIQNPKYETWISTISKPFPSDNKEIKNILYKGMFTQVKFREMISSMYNDRYRVFIQIGLGGLSGFINDTLKGKEYVAIDAASRTKDTQEMIKRVALRLFVEGKDHSIYSSFKSLNINTNSNSSDFSISLKNLLNESVISSISINKFLKQDTFDIQLENELIDESYKKLISKNIFNYYEAQKNVLSLLPKKDKVKIEKSKDKSAINISKQEEISTINEVVNISIEKYPELTDHDIYRYPEHIPIKYRTVIVPMTFLAQLSCELIKKYFPDYNVKSISDIVAFRFMQVIEPIQIKVKITKEASLIYKIVWEDKFYCKIEITKETLKRPTRNNETWVLPEKEKIEDKLGPNNVYKYRWTFHGEKYGGITKIIDTGTKGCITQVKNAGGYSSMLDACYQSGGVFYYNFHGPGNMILPMRLEKIEFFDDFRIMEDISIETEVRVFVEKSDKDTLIYDLEVSEGDQIIMKSKRFIGKKFESTHQLQTIYRYPEKLESVISCNIEDEIFVYERNFNSSWTWIMMLNMYLTPNERERYDKIKSLPSKHSLILGRIALRDGIKMKYMPLKNIQNLHPLEIPVMYDKNGVPYVKGDGILNEAQIKVSIAHKNKIGVAKIGGDKPVGVDVEYTSEVNKLQASTFMSENEKQQARIFEDEENIYKSIVWTAKEAYGKYSGKGIKLNNTAIEITNVKKLIKKNNQNIMYQGIIQECKFKSILWNDYAMISWII